MDNKYKALSPIELRTIWRKNSNEHLPIINYDVIEKANNVNDIFNGRNYCILYYPLQKQNNNIMGHYTAMVFHPHNDILYYYDSYGFKPDGIKKYKQNYNYNEHENSLIRLMLDSPYNVDFSHYKHQTTRDTNVATCGRHSILRCLNNHLSNDEYDKHLKSLKRRNGFKTNDDLVSAVIV